MNHLRDDGMSRPNFANLHERYGTLVSVSLPAPGLTPLGFVAQSAGQARFFWHDGQDPILFGGVGAAVELFAWGESRYRDIERQARDLFEGAVVDELAPPAASPRLFGGFAFTDSFTPDNTWAAFHPAHFVLPHYQLVQHGDEVWLTLNAHIPDNENPADLIPELRRALQEKYEQLLAEPAPDFPEEQGPACSLRQYDISYPLDYQAWSKMIVEATGRMKAGELDKVVLARICEIKAAEPIDVTAALNYLETQYPQCYRFLFEPRPYHAYYGATPELLIKTSGADFATMGLAGSAPRGKTPEKDASNAAGLLNSAKNRYEHALVVDAMRRRLEPLTKTLSVPDHPEIYTLSNIHHLYTPVEGSLVDPQGVLPLVELLHPTPALGGAPRGKALPLLAHLEPVPRGWYAAPIGWLDQNLDGVFSVGIRSAVAQNNRVWAYAGAGIVADSDPQSEWQETMIKFRPILNSLRAI